MTDVRPELIFVDGPQSGQTVALASNVNLVGRSTSAEVHLTDQYASREQFRLSLTMDGWVFENLSSRGTLINSKCVRSPKKQLVLDTGDVLGVGAETVMLFVSAGDDSDQALQAYRQKHATKAKKRKPARPAGKRWAKPVKGEEAGSAAKAEATAPADAAGTPVPPTAPVPKKATEQDERKAKIRKYLIAYATFLIVMGGVVALLASLKGPGRTGRQPANLLSDDAIREAMSHVPKQSPNTARAAMELDAALALHANLPAKDGDAYRCLHSFQLYLAFKRNGGFESGLDEQKYKDVRERVIAGVTRRYKDAWAFMKGRNWWEANDSYEQLLRMLPEQSQDHPVQRKLLQNIREHMTYVKANMGKRRRRRR